MPLPRLSLRGFLSQARSTLQHSIASKQPITFVIGNESADLDSITCAILYAYIKSQTSRAKISPIHIPIANIPKADLSLRPELSPVCKAANIEKEHIMTLDDLPKLSQIESGLPSESTRWILVDHNTLQGQLGRIYSSRVVGVVDHHEDERKVPTDTGDEPRVIETCGSCTSLVTEYVKDDWTELSMGASTSGSTQSQGDGLADDTEVASLWDAQAAQLALASILIDTHNLQDENKTTDQDRRSVEYLEAKINSCPRTSKNFDRSTYFEQIQEAKQSLDALSVRDVLRKDYKQWNENSMTLGMSSVVKPIEYLEDKAKQEQHSSSDSTGSLTQIIKDFAHERSLTIAAVMTTFTSDDGNFRRELMVVYHDDPGKACVDNFIKQCKEELQLNEVDGGDKHQVKYQIWQQGKLSASRKQVGPMLRQAMNSF